MTQHTRIYLDAAGNIIHTHTQTTPITFEPVEDKNIVESHDVELDDHPNGFIRARELLSNMERKAGKIQFKESAKKKMPIRKQVKNNARKI